MTTAMATPPLQVPMDEDGNVGTQSPATASSDAMLRMTTATATPPAQVPTDEDSDGDNTSGAKATAT